MANIAGIPGLDFLQPGDSDFTPDYGEPVDAGMMHTAFTEPGDFVDDKTPMCEADECVMPDRRIEWGGRGRKPKMHKECRAASRRTGARAESGDIDDRPVRVSRSQVTRVTDSLHQGLGEMTGILVPFAPVTAVTIGLRSEKAVHALVEIGKQHPRFMAGLEAAAMAMPYIELGSFLGSVVYAMGVDAGRLNPDSIIGEKLGVAEAARQVGYHETMLEERYEPVTHDGQFSPPPPRFSMGS